MSIQQITHRRAATHLGSGFTSRRRSVRRPGLAIVGFALVAAPLLLGGTASAAVVSTVPLATSGNYSVLASETVTNTGGSILAGSLGLSPGSSITGFPPGIVNAPGTVENTTTAAAQAKLDLTTAYLNAAGRSLTATVTADLTGLTLQGGVYAANSKGALSLTGTVTLDAVGNPDTVFIFQTNSSLTTGSGSAVSLINGAQQCNVFWQIGSSAELGSGSTMVGNVLALTSVSLAAGVTVYGRVMAQTGSVTLITDTFVNPTCATSGGNGSSTSTGNDTVNTSVIPGTGTTSSGTVLIAVGALGVGVLATRIAVRRNVKA